MQINYSSEKYTPYGGLIIIDQLCKKKGIHKLIDQHLGSRGAFTQYSYSDIFMGLVYSQLSNGSAVEDIHELKRKHLVDSFAVCSSDTVLNTIKGLAICNEAHLTAEGIPAHLGYGDRQVSAQIGPNSALVFDVELISFV